MTVDLEAREVRVGLGESTLTAPFEVDDYTRWRLMEGLDDIGISLRYADDIAAFEASRPSHKPVTTPAG